MGRNSAERVNQTARDSPEQETNLKSSRCWASIKCNAHAPSDHVNTRMGWYIKMVIPPNEGKIGHLSQKNATKNPLRDWKFTSDSAYLSSRSKDSYGLPKHICCTLQPWWTDPFSTSFTAFIKTKHVLRKKRPPFKNATYLISMKRG